MKLGEMLIEAGAITAEQLETALRVQQKDGGRIGTNLLELGFVSESTLGAVLAKQLGVPAASAGAIDKVTRSVVALLPVDRARHYRACPIRLDGDRLWVLMSDPTNQSVVAELAALTGHSVRPMVAAETLISYALEKHYGVARPKKSVQMTMNKHLSMHVVPIGEASRPTAPPAVAVAATPIFTPAVSAPPSFNPHAPTAPNEMVASGTDPFGQAPAGPLELDDFAKLLAACADEEALYALVLRFVAQDFERAALLLLRDGLLLGWQGLGQGLDDAALRSFTAVKTALPVVTKALEDGKVRMGRGSPATLGALTQAIGAPGERALMALPLRAGGEPVGCVIAVGGRDDVHTEIERFSLVARKAGWALEMHALRRQILG